MTKQLKKVLALFLAIALCLGAIPFPAFAAKAEPTIDAFSVSTVEVEEPELTSTPEPDDNSSPRGSPESQIQTPIIVLNPDENDHADGTEMIAHQIWPSVTQGDISLLAAIGSSGTLFMWGESLPGGVGTLPTMGEHVGPMPLCAMMIDGNYVAAYCIEHARFVP